MPPKPDSLTVMRKALKDRDVPTFRKALDAEKKSNPSDARLSIEFLMLKIFGEINIEDECRTAAVKMFEKAADVLEEITPLLIYNEPSRQEMGRTLFVAEAASEWLGGIGYPEISRAMVALNTTPLRVAYDSARRAGVVPASTKPSFPQQPTVQP